MERIKPIYIWLGLALLAIVFRFITFLPITIDMDESTYLVMADHMLNGGVLYKDFIDIKPPGIVVIFAAIQFIFGKSIFMVRLMAALVVGTGGFLVYSINRNWNLGQWPSIISGMVYVFMFNFYFGFSANTEIFFVFFTTLGLWVFSKVENAGSKKHYFLSGLFIGFGFLVKLHVAFDALALGLFILIGGLLGKKYLPTIINCTLLTAGFLLPFIATHLIFWFLGYYEYYHYITYEAPFNYSAIRDWGVLAKYFKDGMVTYLPFILMALTGFLAIRNKQIHIHYWLLVLLFGLEWAAILATGKPHPHYWLQLSLPIAVLAGAMFENVAVVKFFTKKVVKIVSLVLVIGYLSFLFNYYHKRYLQRTYHTDKIYEYLKPRIQEGDTIYTGDGPQLLYWLFDLRSPTPHIHQNHLTYPDKIATYKVNVKEEMNRIFATDPRFVILSKKWPHEDVLRKMDSEYQLIKTIEKYRIYEKNE